MTEILAQLNILLLALTSLLSVQLGAAIEPKIELNGKFLTPVEYAQKKETLIARADKYKTLGSHFDTYEDLGDWIAIINRDCKDNFDGLTVEKINEKLKSC